MRHILLCSVWLLVYFASSFFNFSGGSFFTFQVVCSIFLVICYLGIDNFFTGGSISKKTLNILMALTTIFAIFNLVVHFGYYIDNYIFYDVYASVSGTINALEFMVLLIGAIFGVLEDGRLPRFLQSSFNGDLYCKSGIYGMVENKINTDYREI